jgi:hypothetical protein
MLRSNSGATFATAAVIRLRSSTTFAGKGGMSTRSLRNLHKKNSGVEDPWNEVTMLSAPLSQSTDLGNGCWHTRALFQGNEGVHRLAGSERVLLGHLRLTVKQGTVGACPDT